MQLLRKTYNGNIKRQECQSTNSNDIIKADIVVREEDAILILIFAKLLSCSLKRYPATPFIPFARNERD